MRRFFEYVLTVLFYLVVALLMVVFHPIFVVSLWLKGRSGLNFCVDVINRLLVKCFVILKAEVVFAGFENIPKDGPIIIISNHQSVFDSISVISSFRPHTIKFISKIELAKFVPCVSFNLRNGGSALIDRNDRDQALKEIERLGQSIEDEKSTVCIFPEGTRSANGELKFFKERGLAALLKAAPSATVVPFVIDGNYKILTDGLFPLKFGLKLKYSVLQPVSRNNLSVEEILIKSKTAIDKELFCSN